MRNVLANEPDDNGLAPCGSRVAPIDAVLIDLDGTLLDTERLFRASFFAALSEIGYSAVGVHYPALIGRSTPDRRRLLCAWFRDFPSDAFFAAYRRCRDQRFEAGIALKPGALELIAALTAQRKPFAVVTAASRLSASTRLRQAGLCISTLVTRDEVPLAKPDPACMLLAAKLLSVAPERCLVIEDSPPGLVAGHRAGMQVVLVPDLDPLPAWRGSVIADLYRVTELLSDTVAPRPDAIAAQRDFPRVRRETSLTRSPV